MTSAKLNHIFSWHLDMMEIPSARFNLFDTRFVVSDISRSLAAFEISHSSSMSPQYLLCYRAPRKPAFQDSFAQLTFP